MSHGADAAHDNTNYYLPGLSTWPVTASLAIGLLGFGAAMTVNHMHGGGFILLAGFLVLFYMFAGWFSTVAHESEGGLYNAQVGKSFKWGMSWFIFSEVMFFAAFFGALGYMRLYSVPDLGSLEHQQLLWPNFKDSTWPTAGPHFKPHDFSPMHAWGIPALNTALLPTGRIRLWGRCQVCNQTAGVPMLMVLL